MKRKPAPPGSDGARVRALREELGLSPMQLAEVMGVSPATVYRWESVAAPNMEPLQRKIFCALDADPHRRTEQGKRALVIALETRGPLYALFVVLRDFFRGEP